MVSARFHILTRLDCLRQISSPSIFRLRCLKKSISSLIEARG